MSLLKKIFGEKLPVQDLFNLQNKLEKHGMVFMFRDIVQKGEKENERELRKAVVEDILVKSENAKRINQRDLWVASNNNANIKKYQPRNNGSSIYKGDQVVVEVAYEIHKNDASPMKQYEKNLKDDIKSIFDNNSVIEDILLFRYNLKGGDDYSAAISLVNIYVDKHPEIEKTISLDNLIEVCFKSLELKQIQVFNYDMFYQAETHVYGDTINSKSLMIHEVVIDALCAALEALNDRKRFPTFEHLSEFIEQFISSRKITGSAYWKEVHMQFMEEEIGGYPLGYFINSAVSKGDAFRGAIREHQSIYLCPFVGCVHYGVTVVITKNGFKVGRLVD